MPGPVPKRSDQRVRRNKPDVAVSKVTALGSVPRPAELGFDDPHPITAEYWDAMHASAQSRFFEASDWASAKFTLHFADRLLKSQRPSGQMLATVHSMLADLLVSEGSRRKLRLEIDRADATDAQVDVAALFREKLTG